MFSQDELLEMLDHAQRITESVNRAIAQNDGETIEMPVLALQTMATTIDMLCKTYVMEHANTQEN